MAKFFIYIIRIYQRIPGPWHSNCKFQPTCSNYAIGVLKEFGFIKGAFLTIKRLLKCNPWSKGGYDPVPIKKEKR